MNETHVAALTTVADDPRTMLSSGLAPQRLQPRRTRTNASSTHLGAAVHLVAQHRFSANAERRKTPGMLSGLRFRSILRILLRWNAIESPEKAGEQFDLCIAEVADPLTKGVVLACGGLIDLGAASIG